MLGEVVGAKPFSNLPIKLTNFLHLAFTGRVKQPIGPHVAPVPQFAQLLQNVVVVFADAAGTLYPTIVLLLVRGMRGECRWEDYQQEELVLENRSFMDKPIKIKLRTTTGSTKSPRSRQ